VSRFGDVSYIARIEAATEIEIQTYGGWVDGVKSQVLTLNWYTEEK
jgi:hypothetical protein